MAIPPLPPTPPAPVTPVTPIPPIPPIAPLPHEAKSGIEAGSPPTTLGGPITGLPNTQGSGGENASAAVLLEPGLRALNRLRADWAEGLRGRLAQYLTEAEQGGAGNRVPKAKVGQGEEDSHSQSLETLLLRVLSQPGGEKRLLADLRDLPHHAALTLLTAGADAAAKPGRGGAEHPMAPLLRQLLRNLHDQDPMTRPQGLPQAFSASLSPSFSPGQSKQAVETARMSSGWARVLDRQSAGDIQAGSAGASGWVPAPGTPLLRLQLWDGRRAFEMLAPEAPPPGFLARFVFSEATGAQGRLQDYASPTGRLLPGAGVAEAAQDADIRAAYATAGPAGKRALAMAQDVLGEFAEAPWFGQALRDAGRVLLRTGWFGETASPTRSEAESFLRLWLGAPTAPRGSPASPAALERPASLGLSAALESPEAEKVEKEETSRLLPWAQTLRRPETALPGLNLFRPAPPHVEGQAMPMTWLRPDTRLWPADDKLRERLSALLGQGDGVPSSAPGAGQGHKGAPSFPGLTPQGATLEEWAHILSSSSAAAGDGKDGALRTLLHSLAPLAPLLRQDLQPQAEGSMTLFWYQGSQWQSARVHPDVERKAADPERKGSGHTWMATVGWQGQALGEAEAEVQFTEANLAMRVSNEGLFAQAVLAADIPRLEAALAQQGLTLQSWTYRHIAPEAPATHARSEEEASGLRVPRPPQFFDARF